MLWMGANDWQWRRPSIRFWAESSPQTYLKGQEECMTREPFTAGEYKEVEVTVSHKISIPEPFPEQQMSSSPKPLIPFIVLERIEFDLFKVVGIKDVGGIMDGSCAVWGSMLVRVSRFLDKGYKVVTDGYLAPLFNDRDTVVMAMKKAGLLRWSPF